MNNGVKVILAALLISFLGTAAAQNEGRVTRKLNISGDSKYKMCYLDEKVYHYAWQDLGDIRVINGDGQEVPYYLYNAEILKRKEEKQYTGKIIDTFVKDKMYYVDVKVEQEENTDRLISYLALDVDSDNFAASVAAAGSYDGLHWEWLEQGAGWDIYKVKGGSNMKLSFDTPVKYSYFRIKMPVQPAEIQLNQIQCGYEENTEKVNKYIREKDSTYKIDQDAKEKTTVITIENPDHLRQEELEIFAAGSFRRTYQLIGCTADNEEIQLGTGQLFSVNVAANPAESIRVPEGRSYPRLKLVIMNEDDQPIDIQRIVERYSIDKIVFEAKAGEDYELAYGGKDHIAPSYDIVYYEDRIEAEKQDAITMGDVVVQAEKEENKNSQFQQLIYKVLIIATGFIMIVAIVNASLEKNGDNLS